MSDIYKFRMPKMGDRLFRESQDLDIGVDFSGDETSRHWYIWDGYMTAGDLLIQNCKENNPERHILIYPILFNYRHAIELSMKWVIVEYGRYSSLHIDEDKIEHHNLWQLWKLCKEIITELGSESEYISYVEQLIKDFHDADNTAQAFRYPIDKKGVIFTLPDKMIDLQNILDVMEGLTGFFNDVDVQLMNVHTSGIPDD